MQNFKQQFKRRLLRKENGQATIFMALFMGTMILLFAFTTNIGMLVHAKINLQNAADAAAYAGAAVQARQLTSVAYLNWEMRSAVKEFLYLYMVRGSGDHRCYPQNGFGQRNLGACPAFQPTGRYGFEFADPLEDPSTREPDGPYLPTVCIVFDPNNNYCQKGGVPGIPQVRGSGAFGVADPIVNAVKNSIDTIISKKVADCQSRTQVNKLLLIAWLFNLNPNPPPVTASNADTDRTFDIPGLDGLGILPRMAILRARIDNFEEALNLNLANEGMPSSIDDTILSEISTRASGPNLAYFERPIQAFLSAKNNLPSLGDNGIFSNITLSELIPTQAGNVQATDHLTNPPVLAKFNNITQPATFANSIFFEDPNALKGNCKQVRDVRTIPAFPLGVTKDPNVITYYAVQLQAKVRLLFSPFGDAGRVAISAYSAAKPFGSRIGKDLSRNPDVTLVAKAKTFRDDPPPNDFSPRFINLLVANDDADASLGGFSRNDHLGYLRSIQQTFGRRDWAFRVAGAYAPWEVGYFTPPANYAMASGAASNISAFPDNPSFTTGERFQLEAPIIPMKDPGKDISFLRSRIQEFLAGGSVSDGLDKPEFKAFVDAQMNDAQFQILFNYLATNNLMVNHLIADPMLNDLPQVIPYIKGNNGAKFTVAAMSDSQRRQLTSWNNYKNAMDDDPGGLPHSEMSLDMGRSGYSVRFVSFDNLQQGGQASNDPIVPEGWTNPFLRMDAGNSGARFQSDISKIKH